MGFANKIFYLMLFSLNAAVTHAEDAIAMLAVDDNIATLTNKPIVISPLINDQLPRISAVRIASISQPRHGTITVNAQKLLYTPDSTFSGRDYFFYRISNELGQSSTARVFIEVVPSGDTKSPQQAIKSAAATSRGAMSGQNTPARISNPYYKKTQWKLWFEDESPVKGHKVIDPINRMFPVEGNFRTFLNYSFRGNQQKYAGFWDDFYLNQDSGHSRLRDTWSDGKGNTIKKLDKKVMQASTGYFDTRNIKSLGVTFSSQSTTHMGHAISNNSARMRETEIVYYFSNVLRAGPAHVSYMDAKPDRSEDLYQALVPIMLNSYGASGSEMNAISKLLLAGGYLPKKTKHLLKRHGLYASALLYLWKAGLPYQVEYQNELRHRVAYITQPGSRYSWYRPENLFHMKYDEAQHLKNMVELAKGMEQAPPVALLKKIAISSGGKIVYDRLKTTWLILQKQQHDVTITVSTADSFDLQGLDLQDTWTVLYGNNKTKISRIDKKQYRIYIPYDPKLPKGRTVVMLTVNNGYYDSNPAIINIYREKGYVNKRPTLTGLKNIVAYPGEAVDFDIISQDPEGYETRLYRWANEVGTLDGKHFSWQIPEDIKPGKYPVTIISSDGTTGNAYQSKQIHINVKKQKEP